MAEPTGPIHRNVESTVMLAWGAVLPFLRGHNPLGTAILDP